MDLLSRIEEAEIERNAPLAHRMRPRTLDEFAGQQHIVGPGRLLRRAIEADQLSSLIFYGPPGTGKTTLALVIANTTRSNFVTINAVLAGVAKIRAAIAEAQKSRERDGRRTTLFVDEVHRWNKAQQDALLPHVERGTILLIGATTENPFFEVNKALVSRSRIFQLRPLQREDLVRIARAALDDRERGYGAVDVELADDALEHLVDVANGDARSVLNALELAVETTPADASGRIAIDLSVAEESIQRRAVLYDKEGDVHYDTISAFIKSLRGSDPDAALYWMAKMVYAGEDPRFIFRRMAIAASEDVGLADPRAASVVAGCWELYERIGMPEGRFHLAQAALYLATCPKSNSTMAFFDALRVVQSERDTDVPNHLKDPSRDEKSFGHGRGYLYPHAFRDHWVAQQYLPGALQGRVFYQPSDQGYEREVGGAVARRREAQLEAMIDPGEAFGEVLTYSPRDASKAAWLQRAIDRTGQRLGEQRDALLSRAQLPRHAVVLDLNASTGLLTWEAVRRVPEGGVWAQTRHARVALALREQSEKLPELDRVHVVHAPIGELGERLPPQLRFDAIIGRNPLTVELGDRGGRAERVRAWAERLDAIAALLAPGGRLCLLQVIPARAQRLCALVDWSAADESLGARVAAAEAAVYERAADPRLGWEGGDLRDALAEAGFDEIELTVSERSDLRHIDEQLVDRWFPGETTGEVRTAGERTGRSALAYADHLTAGGLDRDEIERARAIFSRQLAGQQVSWRSSHALVSAVAGRA